MLPLKQDFPDIADELVAAAGSYAPLKEALLDYEQACERISDDAVHADERKQWKEIRQELVAEIRHLFLRLEH